MREGGSINGFGSCFEPVFDVGNVRQALYQLFQQRRLFQKVGELVDHFAHRQEVEVRQIRPGELCPGKVRGQAV